MTKGLGVFLTLIALALIAVIGYRFYTYMVQQDFLVYAQVPCDSSFEKCFIYVDEEEPEPYKKVTLPASIAPHCLLENTCGAFSCTEASCEITYCSEEEQEEWEACAAPSGPSPEPGVLDENTL